MGSNVVYYLSDKKALRHTSFMLQRRKCHIGLKNLMYMMTVVSYFYSQYSPFK